MSNGRRPNGAGTIRQLGNGWRWQAGRSLRSMNGPTVRSRAEAERGLSAFLASDQPPLLKPGPIRFAHAIRKPTDDQCIENDRISDGRNRCAAAIDDGGTPCSGKCSYKVCQECIDTTETELVGGMYLCDGCRYSWKDGLGL